MGIYHRRYTRILQGFNRIQSIVHGDFLGHDFSRKILVPSITRRMSNLTEMV